MDALVTRLISEQLEDGGWNCEAENGSVRSSFATTINVLEGLWAQERATGGSAELITARRRGEEYLLERNLFRRKSFTGEVVNPAWLQFSFPIRWHYDVLRALEYFRSAGDSPDPRMKEAIDLPSGRSSNPMVPGCSRIRIAAKSTSRSRKATSSPAGGIRCARLRVLKWSSPGN